MNFRPYLQENSLIKWSAEGATRAASKSNIYIVGDPEKRVNIVFTKHAREQMERRNISEDEVISTIKYPEKTEKVDDIYYVYKKLDRFVLKVVYEKQNYIKVITVHSL